MINAACMICHKKNDTYKENKLRNIFQILNNAKLSPSSECHHYMWEIHSHCPYGMSCVSLMSNDNSCKRFAIQINPLLDALATSDDTHCYYEILHLLQGDFPAVYNQLERNWHFYHQSKKGDKNEFTD